MNSQVVRTSFHLFIIILLYYGAKVSFFREKTKKKCIFLMYDAIKKMRLYACHSI